MDVINKRKNIISKAVKHAYETYFCSEEDLDRNAYQDNDYAKFLVRVLRHYRSSTRLDGENKNLLNQMIVDNKFIPYFEVSQIELKLPQKEFKEKSKEGQISAVSYKKPKEKISKRERALSVIEKEKVRQREILKRSMNELIDDAYRKLGITKKYCEKIAKDLENDAKR